MPGPANPRFTASLKDIRDPDRLHAIINRLLEHDYELLERLETERNQQATLGSEALRRLLLLEQITHALTIGGPDSALPPQRAAAPSVTELPPVSTSVDGELVWFNNSLYRFDSPTQSWVQDPASAHNLLSAAHSDSLAAGVVRGDLVVGNSTPKWARIALGAAFKLLRVNAGATDPEWGNADDSILSSNVPLKNANNTFTAENTFKRTGNGELILALEGANGFKLGFYSVWEEFNISTVGPTTDTGVGFLPANAEILSPMGYRIVTTISGGGVTNFDIGDAATPERFAANQAGLAAGISSYGNNHRKGSVVTEATGPTQAAAAAARVTCDATPTAGRIRLHHIAQIVTSPTS